MNARLKCCKHGVSYSSHLLENVHYKKRNTRTPTISFAKGGRGLINAAMLNQKTSMTQYTSRAERAEESHRFGQSPQLVQLVPNTSAATLLAEVFSLHQIAQVVLDRIAVGASDLNNFSHRGSPAISDPRVRQFASKTPSFLPHAPSVYAGFKPIFLKLV